jgi:serine/threonine protein kinase
VAAGRHRIETRPGRGAAASVFMAVDTSTQKRVALERSVENASSRLASLFEREYHPQSRITHPNIVEVYDDGSDASGPYYVMELLEGGDLSAYLRLDWRSAARAPCHRASWATCVRACCSRARCSTPQRTLRARPSPSSCSGWEEQWLPTSRTGDPRGRRHIRGAR